MKKILSLLLAVTFVVSAVCIPVSATYADQSSTAYIQYGTTAHDLRAYGIQTFQAYKITGAEPSLSDARLDPSQYVGTPTVSTLGAGLTLTNSTATTDYTDTDEAQAYKDVKLTTYLAYNDQFLFIGEKVESPVEFGYMTASGAQDTLNTNVRYGLNQSTAIPEAASRLSNTYEYKKSGSTFQVSSCASGNRTYKVIDGNVSKSVTLDSEMYADWDLEKYSDNAAVFYEEVGGIHTYEFEYKIPLADVLYSAIGKYDDAEVAKLLQNPQFYGSYLFQVAVTRTGGENGKTQLYLTTGYPGGRSLAPYSDPDSTSLTTWAKAVKSYWTNQKGESVSIVYVPSPVVHTSDASAQIPAATGFRPGLTGYSFDQFKSVHKIGETVTFTVIPDAVENTAPKEGDMRVIPSKFRVRNAYDTKLTGTFASDFKTAQFSTAKLPVGLNTLVVTFVQQRFDGTKWVDTTVTRNLSKNFTVTGSVMGQSQGSSQTGDNTTVLLVGGAVMLLAAAAFSIVVISKKKSR